MVMAIMIIWAILGGLLVWDNMEVLSSVSVWRSAVAIVILTASAPVFFLSDFLEVLLDLIMSEEDGEE